MFRGTTPTLTFELPIETDLIAEAWVTFSQEGNIVINKTLADCTQDGKDLIVRLTQLETLALSPNIDTGIQIRIRTTSGDAWASDIMKQSTKDILKDGEI